MFSWTSINISVLQLSAAAFLLVMTVVFSCAPFMLRRFYAKSRVLMSVLTCLAGGAVLGALLLHMIPELSHNHFGPKLEIKGTPCKTCKHVIEHMQEGLLDLGFTSIHVQKENNSSTGTSGPNSTGSGQKRNRTQCTASCGGKGCHGPRFLGSQFCVPIKPKTNASSKSKSKSASSSSSKSSTTTTGTSSESESSVHSNDDTKDPPIDSTNRTCSHDHGEHKHAHDCSHSHGMCDVHHSDNYPWGLFFAGVSFLMLLAIDRFFMHSHSHDHEHASPQAVQRAADRPDSVVVDGASRRMVVVMGRRTSATLDAELTSKTAGAPEQREPEPDVPVHDHPCTDPECNVERVLADGAADDDCASCHSENIVGGCHMDGLDRHSSGSKAIVFVLALSMHSFLEGLGMGTQNTYSGFGVYALSLVGHKWLEAFALGVNVMNASFSLFYSVILIVFYAVLTPAGMLIGMGLIQHFEQSRHIGFVASVLNGMAVGSFLFVSCIEMIPPEFHKRTPHTPLKFAALCVSFLVMAVLAKVAAH